MEKINKLILFFNQGDKVCYKFTKRADRNYNFYWFHDGFYSHCAIDNQDRYLHLFVRNPMEDGISFFERSGLQNFDELVQSFRENKEKLMAAYHKEIGFALACNPPILLSTDILVPDIILDFKEPGADTAEIISPEALKGTICRLFDSAHIPIPFIEIPELVSVIPLIKNAYPCID